MRCLEKRPFEWLKRRACIGVAGVLLASGSAMAQSTRADIRAQLDGAALGVGYAQLVGLSATPEIATANYTIDIAGNKPTLDGLVFDWHTNAWLVTPSVGLEYATTVGGAKATGRATVGRSWITSFGESDAAQSFREAASVYAIRADHSRPAGLSVAARPLNWVVYGGYAGFFGVNRDALGFSSVAEIGAGLELPTSANRPQSERARLAAGLLFGPNVRGWTVGVSMRY